MRDSSVMLLGCPQTQTASRRRTPGPSGPLVCRRLANRLDIQGVNAAVRVETCDPRQTGVDHGAHAVNRNRGLGHVGGNDDFAARSWTHGPVLFGWRQLTI